MSRLMTKPNKMACAPSEDSDQPGHPPSLLRVFTVRMKKVWVLSYPLSTQRRLWSDWADAQADLCFRWVHSHFLSFVMRRLIFLQELRNNMSIAAGIPELVLKGWRPLPLHPPVNRNEVARTVMCRQDVREWFPVLLDDLSKCRTNSPQLS